MDRILAASNPKLVVASKSCSLQRGKGQTKQTIYASAANCPPITTSSPACHQLPQISEILAAGNASRGRCRCSACLTTQKAKLYPTISATAAVAAGPVKYPKNQPIDEYALVNQSQGSTPALTANSPKQMLSRYFRGRRRQYLFSYSFARYLPRILLRNDSSWSGCAGATSSLNDVSSNLRCYVMISLMLSSQRVAYDVVCILRTSKIFFLRCSGPDMQSVSVLAGTLGAPLLLFFSFLLKLKAKGESSDSVVMGRRSSANIWECCEQLQT